MMSLRWFLLAFVPLVSTFTATHQSTTLKTISSALKAVTKDEEMAPQFGNSRRQLLATTALGILSTALPAQAATGASKDVLNNLLTAFRSVPTFCLVNAEGIPYMVIKQQERMAKGYAFTSMEGAIVVLNDAQRTAKEKGYFDIWESATVVTLPGDVAVRMALQKRERITTRGSNTMLDSLIDIIPTNENREAAMMIDKRGFQDQGKMPLFYVNGLVNGEDETMPLFVQKTALINAWQQQRPGEALPPIQAMDLTYMFEAALRGYVDKLPNGGKVSFVPDPEQVKIAQKLRSEGLTMYKFDKMVV